ncbi:Uncharacterised protein [Morganella morganii]|uniref:hypothetical protein n=1 Tax=Morganella morganii TaxID=582 RepID=UPI000D8383A5|nr:hypothetical protein [Morganella morganii]SPX91208.1 Uncharacterised protein [Morganella morganii]
MINRISAYGAVFPEGNPQEMSAGMTTAAVKPAVSGEFRDIFPSEPAALYQSGESRKQLYLAARPVIDPQLAGQPVLFCHLLSDLCLLIHSESDPDIVAAFPILSSLLDNMLLLISHKNLMIKV